MVDLSRMRSYIPDQVISCEREYLHGNNFPILRMRIFGPAPLFSSSHSIRRNSFAARPPKKIPQTDESARTPPIRTTPLRIQPRIRHPRRRRSRHHCPAGLEREENHGASLRRCWRPKRPSQEDITQGASPRAAPRTPGTPPPSAVAVSYTHLTLPTILRV